MSNSGTSTPRDTAVTPPPAGGEGGGPSPLVIGARFVKQYYQVLATTPENLHRIYQPTSVLSQGQGSQPAQPDTFETQSDTIKDRFVLDGFDGCTFSVNLDNGAIDAQFSVNDGILLVVTGHIVYMPKSGEEESSTSTRKPFVHTFFLEGRIQGGKRNYYIHNDVLRFLSEVEDDKKAAVADSSGTPETKSTLETAGVIKPPEELAETEKIPTNGGTDTVEEEAPGGGVEESKETEKETKPPAPASTPPPPSMEEAPGGGVEESKDEIPAAGNTTPERADATADSKPSPKPTPGSWASLVASGAPAPGTGSVPGTPSRPTAAASATSPKPKTTPIAPATKPKPAVEVSKSDGPIRGGRNIKRDPDCTLVIKNLDVATTEPEVIGLFEPFAVQCEGKIVGITVSAHKNIAFVDYDTSVPVLKAVEQHEKEPLQLHGRKLEMYQKTLEQGRGGRGRGGRGYHRGGGRGGVSGSGGGDYRGSDRQQYRRDRSGRGDRGGAPGSSGRGSRGGGQR